MKDKMECENTKSNIIWNDILSVSSPKSYAYNKDDLFLGCLQHFNSEFKWQQEPCVFMSPGCVDELLQKLKSLNNKPISELETRWVKDNNRFGLFYNMLLLGYLEVISVGAHRHWCWVQKDFIGITETLILKVREKQKELFKFRKNG